MKKSLLLILFVITVFISHAQSVAINADASPADASSLLDIKSNSKGILIPRMTNAAMNGILNPATGLLIFNTSTGSFWYRSSLQWEELMISNNNHWSNTGSFVYNTAFTPVSISNNGYSPIGVQLNVTKETVSSNSNENILSITHAFAGTPSNGIGAGLVFKNQLAPGSVQITGKISSLTENISLNTNAMQFDVFDATGIPSAILYLKPGNVGIGTSNPQPAAKLDVNGDIRSSSLAGSGNRPVYVNADGYLFPQNPQAHYLSIPSAAFKAREDVANYNSFDANGDCFFNTGSTDIILAPVYLPHGATVSRVTLYYVDNSSSDLVCRLIYHANNFGSSILMAFLQTSGAATGYNAILDAVISDPVIDNAGKLYSIQVSAINGNWTGSNLKVKGAMIEYTF